MESIKGRKNFSESDREILANLVTPFVETIKDVKKDTVTLTKKEKAWKEITVGFNASPIITTPRTVDQLKKSWDNMCRRAKQEVAKTKMERRKTGGGPMGQGVTAVHAIVASTLADSLNPLDNPYDGDADHLGKEVIPLSPKDDEITTIEELETSKTLKENGSKYFI